MYHHEIKGGGNAAEIQIVVITSPTMKGKIENQHHRSTETHGTRGPGRRGNTPLEMGVT